MSRGSAERAGHAIRFFITALNMYLVQKEAWERQAGTIQGGQPGTVVTQMGKTKIHSLLHKSGANSSPVFGKHIRIYGGERGLSSSPAFGLET